MGNELVDWDSYVSRVCEMCGSGDIITDMSRGDVICRGCGTCLRERVAVDDSDTRLDDAPGEESTVKKSAVKRPTVGLDDRGKKPKRGMDFDIAAAEVEAEIMEVSTEKRNADLYAFAGETLLGEGEYAKSKFLEASEKKETVKSFAELHERSMRHVALRAKARDAVLELCDRLGAPESLAGHAGDTLNSATVAVLEEVAKACRRKLKGGSREKAALEDATAHAVALTYHAARQVTGLALGLRELGVATSLPATAVAAAFRALQDGLTAAAPVVAKRPSEFIPRIATKLVEMKKTLGTDVKKLLDDPARWYQAQSTASEFGDEAYARDGAGKPAVYAAAALYLAIKNKHGAKPGLIEPLAKAASVAKKTVDTLLGKLSQAAQPASSNNHDRMKKKQKKEKKKSKKCPGPPPPQQAEPSETSPLSVTTPFDAPSSQQQQQKVVVPGNDDDDDDDDDQDDDHLDSFFEMPLTSRLPPPPI